MGAKGEGAKREIRAGIKQDKGGVGEEDGKEVKGRRGGNKFGGGINEVAFGATG